MRVEKFAAYLDQGQRAVFSSLNSPIAIQAFLDEIPFCDENITRCPLRVLRDREAHCTDGATLAATALQRLGYPPIIMDLLPEPGLDDDHVLAIFKRDGCFGAVAKSEYIGLRFREPVYRSLRELAMSYFDFYYNHQGQKTLRGYTMPLHLRKFDPLDWISNDDAMAAIQQGLESSRKISLLTPQKAAELSPVDRFLCEASYLRR